MKILATNTQALTTGPHSRLKLSSAGDACVLTGVQACTVQQTNEHLCCTQVIQGSFREEARACTATLLPTDENLLVISDTAKQLTEKQPWKRNYKRFINSNKKAETRASVHRLDHVGGPPPRIFLVCTPHAPGAARTTRVLFGCCT